MILSAALALLLTPVAHANPWNLELGHDRSGSRVSMSYRIRWDFSDLKRAPRPKEFLASARGIWRGVRLEVYGMRLRPFRRDEAPESAGRPGQTALARASEAVVSDLRADARRQFTSFLIRSAFNRALPKAAGAPGWEKDAVVAGLFDTGRVWADEAHLPGGHRPRRPSAPYLKLTACGFSPFFCHWPLRPRP
ncbi:MAG: hypothetical protein HY925_10465 [Elusimicrobia bacterium]|nr:hypothetical protein [Elusimicrobiota bacterium]